MAADRTNTDPSPGKSRLDSAGPRLPASGKAGSRDDEAFKQSMAELSRRLGERVAQQSTGHPAAAATERRAALQAYDLARERRQIAMLGVAVAAVIGAGIVYFISTTGSRPVPPSETATVRPESASPVALATITPAPPPPEPPLSSPAASSPSPAANLPSTPAAEPAAEPPAAPTVPAADSAARPSPARTEPAPATSSQPVRVEPPANPASLRRDDVREVQARLRSFGFDPGPADGVAGAMTEGAVKHYQRGRGQAQTGNVDRDLLEQLRQDPAPQLAQRAARPAPRPASSSTTRRSDPFEPVRAAGDRLGRWLESVIH